MERRLMSLTERLRQENEPKSTRLACKMFQRFITRSAKKLDLTQLLQKCLKILSGCPLVELDRNWKKSLLGLREQAHKVLYTAWWCSWWGCRSLVIADDLSTRLAIQTLEEMEWCLEQLEKMQTHRSVANMATNKVFLFSIMSTYDNLANTSLHARDALISV